MKRRTQMMIEKCSKKHHDIIPGIKKNKDGTYLVDVIKIVQGERVHIYSNNHQSVKDAKEVLEALIKRKKKEFQDKGKETMPLIEYLDQYEKYLSDKLGKESLNREIKYLNTIFDEYKTKEVYEALSYPVIEEIYDYIVHIDKHRPNYKNRYITAIKKCIKYAYDSNLISLSLYKRDEALLIRIKEHRKVNKKLYVPSDKETKELFKVIEDDKDYLFYLLIIELGVVPRDIVSLSYESINIDKRIITIDDRECPLSDKAIDIINRLSISNGKDRYIFSSPFVFERPIKLSTMRMRLNRYISISHTPNINMEALRRYKWKTLIKQCIDLTLLKRYSQECGLSEKQLLRRFMEVR